MTVLACPLLIVFVLFSSPNACILNFPQLNSSTFHAFDEFQMTCSCGSTRTEKRVMGAELLGVGGLRRAVQFPLIPKDFCATLFKSPVSFRWLLCGDKVTCLARGREGILYVL